MLAAAADALAELGYARATVSQIVARAGVSRRTFYEQFDDKDACFLAAFDETERRAWRLGGAVVAMGDEWPQRVEAALAAVLDFFAVNPAPAHLFTLEARVAGPPMRACQDAALERMAAALREGNRAARGRDDLPEHTERILIDQAAAVAGSYVLTGAAPLLPTLAPRLAAHLLAPYWESAARRISSAAARGPT
jgi:AcrR family transcriptional regulator